jgi:hypothetical protein
VAAVTIGPLINIGERPRRLQLDGPGKPVPDGDGGYTTTFAPLDPPMVSAKVEPATTRSLERVAAGSVVVSTATHVITMPFHPGVTTQTRITWTDDANRPHTANVTSVNNVDERCHTLILAAAEMVP